MKESVDNKLKEHIIAVFNNYDDNGAELGWLELRKKHPRKSGKRILFWWSSAAAVLAMALFFYKPQETLQDTVKIQKTKPQTPAGPENKGSDRFQNKTDAGSDVSELIKSPAIASARQYSKVNTAEQHADIRQDRTLPMTPATASVNENSHREQAFSEDNIQAVVIENAPAQTEAISRQQAVTDTILMDKKANTLKENQLAGVLVEKRKEQPAAGEISHNKKVELTFFAGAFLNYAEGSNNSMNMGAGVSSGIPLTKRFTLVAGIALAKNKLIFKNELPNTSYLAFVASDNKAASSFFAGNVPQISKLEASLLNLDIPVNIKYSLSRKPNRVFVSAGLSSFAYLNEAYRYSYNNMNNRTNTFASSDDQVINESFGKFDLAQTLNFSFGLTHTGKAQNIIVEPFIKYPLGTLGSQDIRFGSAGLNLKLNINQAAKSLKPGSSTVK